VGVSQIPSPRKGLIGLKNLTKELGRINILLSGPQIWPWNLRKRGGKNSYKENKRA